MKHLLIIFTLLLFTCSNVMAIDTNTYMSPEYYHHFGKQQIKTKDKKGRTIFITPNYSSYAERNEKNTEKIVAIYSKYSPAYGYRYVIYTPLHGKIYYHRIVQRSLNGYGFDPIPDGGEGSKTPCFKTIQDAIHYYYPDYKL